MAGAVSRALGRGLVQGMPVLLKLSVSQAPLRWSGWAAASSCRRRCLRPDVDRPSIHVAGEAAARALPLIAGLARWFRLGSRRGDRWVIDRGNNDPRH